MVLIRSCLFSLCLVIWTLVTGILFLPALLLPRHLVYRLGRFWSAGVIKMLRVIVGLRHKVVGQILPDPETKYIYALKHQSAWETIAFVIIAPPFAGVLKRELKRIPIYGWYLARTGMVPIRRSAKGSALKKMLAAARTLIAEGRHLMIMPEGTRVAAGQTGVYHPGVYALYKYLEMPVLPVAHNAGLFWGRNSFIKKPGLITLEFLEPIPPGLDKKTFLATLQNRIENSAGRLHNEGLAAQAQP